MKLTDELLAELGNIAPPKFVKIDPQSLAYLTGGTGSEIDGEVEVDLDYEFTPYSFEEIAIDEFHELEAGLEQAFKFPGSIQLKRASPGWFVRRSKERDLALKGTIGWHSEEDGKVLCCVLTDGKSAYSALIVRDPDFEVFTPGLRPLEVHRE